METTFKKSPYFTSLNYYNKRDAAISLFEAFTRAGWKTYGYKEDQSDSMTDYFSPARWDGVATKQDLVICINVPEHLSKSYSGTDIKQTHITTKPCEQCNSTGIDPEGWTLLKARLDPIKYNLRKFLRQQPGATVNENNEIITADGKKLAYLVSDLVSPITFHSNGNEKCRKCLGKGSTVDTSEAVVLDTWPEFQPNPKRKAWHLERKGEILASGISIAKFYEGYYESKDQDRELIIRTVTDEFVATLEKYLTVSTQQEVIQPSETKRHIELIDYNTKSIALKGDTKPHKDSLGKNGLRGLYNSKLTDPRTGEKFAGWIFSNAQRTQVEEFLKQLS